MNELELELEVKELVILEDEKNILLTKLEAYNENDLQLTDTELSIIHDKLEKIYHRIDEIEGRK